MKDYIEREAALAICEQEYQERLKQADWCGDTVAWNIGGAIKGLPAADVVPVRHAAKAESAISKTGLMCTACYSDIDADAVYCKYCGAMMDGEKADNA